MSDLRDPQAKRPATERAEQLVDRLGEQIGRMASLLGQGAARMAGQEPAPPPPPPGGMPERMGERVGRFLARSGGELRRAAALAQEEAEDVWAEAQYVRRERGTPTE